MAGGNHTAARRIGVALAVSAALVALLYRLATRLDATHEGVGLGETLRSIQLPLVAGYLLAQIAQTVLRAWRYRLLLRGSGEPLVPGLLPLTLVTAARNMFVDMLPARIGELSYAALLNRRYGVRLRSAVSSLGLAVFLDVAALLGVLAALLAAGTAGGASWGGPAGSAAMLAVLVLALTWAVFRGPRLFVALADRMPRRIRERPLPARAIAFLVSVAADVDAVRGSGALPGSLALSVGIRLCKYAGLYAAFLAVTESSFGRLFRAPVREVIVALVAGEGAAAIPVPSFMSFGTYESGGLAALVAFGYPAAQVLSAFLALHLVSQAIDYGLGGLALIGIAMSSPAAAPAVPAGRRRRVIAGAAALGAAAIVAAGGLLWRRHEQQRRGLAAAPPPGAAAQDDPAMRSRLEMLLGGRRGFVVWSSNRHGTHDILRMDLPGGEITRLTSEPHTDTYPRVSPDGRAVVFSRSQVPWVSQRDPLPWDAWSVDASGGSERLIARNATGPFWSGGGGSVFFQRNGGEFVEHRLDGGVERVVFSAGVPPVPAGVQVQSPDYDEAAGRLVATLRGRGAPRITALFAPGEPMQPLGGAGDCQIAWSPDRRSLFFVGHGGRQQNALYTLAPGGQAELWLDLPGDLSHEYFPRQSADGRFLVFAASAGGGEHEHDTGDYELFLWRIGDPADQAVRLTHHTGNDSWPDVYLFPE